jgi:hypothetical protein
MSLALANIHPLNLNTKQDAHHLALARAAIALGRKVLKDNPPPSTFAGGKTHGTFAQEPDGDEDAIAVKETTKVNRRELELRHLSTADARIATLERVVSEQMARVEKPRRDGHDMPLSEETLRTFEANLQLMHDHRDVIIRTIEEIDFGL